MQCVVNKNMFPDRPRPKNLRTKETTVSKFLEDTFPDFTWTFNKRVEDGCSKRRPDALVQFGTHLVIVEIDEHRHCGYNILCNHRRMVEILQDNNHSPVVFIRFNPDAYFHHIRHGSCWSMNKLGYYVISKQREWETRLETLKQTFLKHTLSVPEKSITEEYLFYD